MTYHISGLDPAPFRHLHVLSDAELVANNIRRVRVEEKPGAPCRISLADAEIGEYVLLLNHEHQPAVTPYRQQGPIFVRETEHRFEMRDVTPPALAIRLLSLRGFDAEGMMIEADIVEGVQAPLLIERLFENPQVAYIHAHYARRGCFAALIER